MLYDKSAIYGDPQHTSLTELVEVTIKQYNIMKI